MAGDSELDVLLELVAFEDSGVLETGCGFVEVDGSSSGGTISLDSVLKSSAGVGIVSDSSSCVF